MTDFHVIEPEEKIGRGVTPYVTFPLINSCTQKCVYCGDGAEMTLCDTRMFNARMCSSWMINTTVAVAAAMARAIKLRPEVILLYPF